MKKIRLFFSIVVIILIILSIFIYIFLNNFEKEKIISDIEKKFEIKINEKNKTKINIFPIIKLNTNLEIKDYKNNLYFDNIRIDISQPVFQVSGNLDILIDNLNINNINFSEVNINGKVNYIENYLKYSDNLENLFDSIYKINGKITLETTNEEKFLISFLKLFFEKLENQKNQKFAFSELINAFGNESSNFKGAINKNKNILVENLIVFFFFTVFLVFKSLKTLSRIFTYGILKKEILTTKSNLGVDIKIKIK